MRQPLHVTRRTSLLSLLGSLVYAGPGPAGRRTGEWCVYYGSQEPIASFEPYAFLVFDSRYHPPLSSLLKGDRTVVGYLSLGEASPDYTYFKQLQTDGLLVRPSPTWQGNQYIDLRDPKWATRVIDDLVPWILDPGFNGVFLDTVDSALSLEDSDPITYRGMATAAGEILASIRMKYPEITIVLNRAYKLLPDYGSVVDAVVGESVYSTYNFDSKTYGRVDEAAYRLQVSWLQAALERHPNLTVLTLDYCDPEDASSIEAAYAEERKNGFLPYVASIDLARFVPYKNDQ